jgi:translation initiation factor 1A
MPKNKGKGGKGKRKGKNKKGAEVTAKELVLKTVDQEYGQVTKILGNCRVEVFCFDGKERLAKIRGSFKKRVWIVHGDIVLLGLRTFEDGKCDIIHKYHANEVRKLRMKGHIPSRLPLDEQDEDENADIVQFVSDEEDDDDDVNVDDL